MSGATFPSSSSEEAEMNRIHYELEYTEGISQRMRIPDTLKVAPENQHGLLSQPLAPHMMHVPERIVITGDDGDSRYSRPRDLDLIQSTPPVDLLNMKAPPRILTLNEHSLDSLETDQAPTPQAHANQGVHSRSLRERTVSDTTSIHQSGPANRTHVSVTLSPVAPPLRACPPLCTPEDVVNLQYSAGGLLSYIQCTTRRAYQQVLEVLEVDIHRRAGHLTLDADMTPDDSGLVDASSLRRQIVKLNRRLQLLEEENKERSKREERSLRWTPEPVPGEECTSCRLELPQSFRNREEKIWNSITAHIRGLFTRNQTEANRSKQNGMGLDLPEFVQ